MYAEESIQALSYRFVIGRQRAGTGTIYRALALSDAGTKAADTAEPLISCSHGVGSIILATHSVPYENG